ncbi:MAG TPA: DUF4148 domain-containing protein [Paraburkholderia sp.]
MSLGCAADLYRNVYVDRTDTQHCNSARSRHKPDTSSRSNASTTDADEDSAASLYRNAACLSDKPTDSFHFIQFQENDMKVSMIALAFAAFATTASAYAVTSVDANAAGYSAPQTQQWTPGHSNAMAKTRQDVRQELVQAQKDGQLAALNKLYQGS